MISKCEIAFFTRIGVEVKYIKMGRDSSMRGARVRIE